jgi:hypothetical protein
MVKAITNVDEKLSFYKENLKSNTEMYVLFSNEEETIPLCIFRTEKAKSGFAELKCQLLGGFTYNKNSKEQEKFMKEQGYTIINNLAYDVQPIFDICDFDVYLGDFKIITKAECAIWLKSH